MCCSAWASTRPAAWPNSPPGCGSSTSPSTRCARTCTAPSRRQERRGVTAYGGAGPVKHGKQGARPLCRCLQLRHEAPGQRSRHRLMPVLDDDLLDELGRSKQRLRCALLRRRCRLSRDVADDGRAGGLPHYVTEALGPPFSLGASTYLRGTSAMLRLRSGKRGGQRLRQPLVRATFSLRPRAPVHAAARARNRIARFRCSKGSAGWRRDRTASYPGARPVRGPWP
jgi:hypothetical protein